MKIFTYLTIMLKICINFHMVYMWYEVVLRMQIDNIYLLYIPKSQSSFRNIITIIFYMKIFNINIIKYYINIKKFIYLTICI